MGFKHEGVVLPGGGNSVNAGTVRLGLAAATTVAVVTLLVLSLASEVQLVIFVVFFILTLGVPIFAVCARMVS